MPSDPMLCQSNPIILGPVSERGLIECVELLLPPRDLR